MSIVKQSATNKLFTNTVVSAFFETQDIKSVANFCMWLVKCEIMPERILNNWLAVYLYANELNRTKTESKPRGVKWVAETKVLQQVPISQRKLQNLLKNVRKGAHPVSAYKMRKT